MKKPQFLLILMRRVDMAEIVADAFFSWDAARDAAQKAMTSCPNTYLRARIYWCRPVTKK